MIKKKIKDLLESEQVNKYRYTIRKGHKDCEVSMTSKKSKLLCSDDSDRVNEFIDLRERKSGNK